MAKQKEDSRSTLLAQNVDIFFIFFRDSGMETRYDVCQTDLAFLLCEISLFLGFRGKGGRPSRIINAHFLLLCANDLCCGPATLWPLRNYCCTVASAVTNPPVFSAVCQALTAPPYCFFFALRCCNAFSKHFFWGGGKCSWEPLRAERERENGTVETQ